MKQWAVAFLFLLISTTAFAAEDEETLVRGKIEHNGFGALVVKLTEIHGETGVLLGLRGGWIINHKVVVGGGVYGLFNDIQAKGISYDERLDLDLTLGGFEFEYVSRSAKLIHYSLRALIGSGEVNYIGHDRPINDTLFYYHRESFFVAEPEVNLILNVTKFFRLGVGASYRFVSSVNLEGLTNSDLDGPSASLILKFGRF
jgi:hypothetical protein